MIEKPKTLEDYKEIFENHMELCNILNDNISLVPEKLMCKIEDVLYKHFCP